MGMPRWTVNKWKYAAIEATLSAVPLVGGALTSGLKLVLQTDEEKLREKHRPIVSTTQEEYDALDPPDENTVYFIVGKKDTKR